MNHLLIAAVMHLDAVFERHQYRLDGSADDWCYNRRYTRSSRSGSKIWSLHSWAIALDINATTNPYSKRFKTDFTPQIIADVQALTHPVSGARVWQWGGTWTPTHDAMHFQISLTPEECRTLPPPKAPDSTGTVPVTDDPVATEAEERDLVALAGRLGRVEEQMELVTAVVGGAPYATLADWMLATVLGRDPTRDEIAVVEDRFAAGETAEQVYRSLRAKGSV